MTNHWITAKFVFDGQDLLPDHAVRITDGRVTDIAPAEDGPRIQHHLITPGFVDLQVNGGGGVMLNSTPTVDGMRAMLAAHRGLGTAAILPTVITDHPDVLTKACDAALACKNDPNLLGLHIEGPHIALEKRGTHAAEFIRPLDAHTMDHVAHLRAAGVEVMITLAPEAATNGQIAGLADMGAIVSLGHTNAAAPAMRDAIDAGARCGTHLYNAMSQMTARDAGAVGTLISSHCATGFICDGHHVADEMIALAIRARPEHGLMFLVSDAMATVGGPSEFDLYGQNIHLENGKLINSDGNLAGAHVTQAQGVQRLVQRVGVDLRDALLMAITTPAHVINRPDLATLIGRDALDVITLSKELDFCAPLSSACAP